MSGVFWTAVASGVGVFASGGVAIWVTRRQVRSAQGIAKLQREHELRLASDAREQTRKEAAYHTVALYLAMAEQDMRWLGG